MANQNKTKEYRELRKVLKGAGWSVDESHLADEMVLARNKGKAVALKLFYGDAQCGEWVADEDCFLDGAPLWFTEQTHAISPVSQLLQAVNSSDLISEVTRSIVVLIGDNSILNADDIIGVWSDLKVRVVTLGRIKELITDDKLLTFRTSTKDIEVKSADLSDTNDDIPDFEQDAEFLRELNDFIESEGIEINSTEDSTIEEQQQFIPQIKSLRFALLNPNEVNLQTEPHTATHFRFVEGAALYVWVDFLSEAEWEKAVCSRKMIFGELRDSKNNLIQRTETYAEDAQSPANIFTPDGGLVEGEYWCYILFDEKEICAKKIVITNTNELASDVVEVYLLVTLRQDKIDVHPHRERLPVNQSCFNIENLAGVDVGFIIKSRVERAFEAQLVVKVLDELGRIIFESAVEDHFDGKGDSSQFTVPVWGQICTLGRYLVRVEFLGDAIAESQIVIGHKDVETKFTPLSIKPKPNRFLTMTPRSSATTPMEELMEMVGLTGLKERVKLLTSLAKINKARKTRGLPVNSQQLHFAFLGNPGTGKTTVAKLLGRIYKDLGLLSKGHVVLRERSTLMGQNWGSEGDKVQEALEEAWGGVLFIDEAYDLVTEHEKDPGRLILSALLTAMSDDRNRNLMVIFAGYTQPMERLLSINDGLSSRLEKLYFDDFNAEELMQVASLWLRRNCYTLTKSAKDKLRIELESAYAMRSANFGNGRYVHNLLEKEVQPAMAERIAQQKEEDLTVDILTTIEDVDIPARSKIDGAEDALARLNSMVGLETLKGQLDKHLSMVRFSIARRDCNINTTLPPLHMVFTGNPGTGKTTVADYLGEIYRSMGILSVGNVIKVSRADIVGGYIGETEKKMKNLLNAAHGNILFIDEAYTLFTEGDSKDFGKKAIDMLLNMLDKETCDFIVILAGYPKEMEKFLASNVGLRGRFPYSFYFEDYDEEELMQIAVDVAERNSLTLSDEASRAILAVIRQAVKFRDESFSNARFVVRLLTTQIIPAMAQRLEGEQDAECLKLVLPQDVPIASKQVDMIIDNTFDEDAIADALSRLDSLVGLTKVKSAIHNFVAFARSVNQRGKKTISNYNLKWSFVGNSGTGKSTVAEILSQILKAMHLLGKGHTVELKAEELYNVSTNQAEMLVRERMQQSLQGLLFVDGDAPEFKSPESNFNPDHLRMSLAVSTSQMRGHFAVVIAEHFSPRVELARSLSHIGIHNFDHTLIFEDYTSMELLAVLEQCLERDGLYLDDAAEEIMQRYINRLEREYRSLYANARTMRLLANAIHKRAVIDGSDGVVSAAMVSEFDTYTPHRKPIGY